MWNKVKVYPWVGKNYESNLLLPYRTLILGESNYTTEENFDSNLVISCIEDHIGNNSDDNFSRFATKVRRVALGRDTEVSAKEFWENCSFYNFVQYRVGDFSKERPTQKMWDDSVDALDELINSIKPERMLVIGKENWTNLLIHIRHRKIDSHKAIFELGKNKIVSAFIFHPSSGGGYFTYDAYGPIARDLIFGENA